MRDLSPPTWPESYPINWDSLYDGRIPVYWIAGQKLVSGDYQFEPVMPRAYPLQIPKVVRFLYTYGEEDVETDKWCDATSADCAGGDGETIGGCPPPGEVYTILTGPNPPFFSESVFDVLRTEGQFIFFSSLEALCSGTVVIKEFVIVGDGVVANTVYSGSVRDYNSQPRPANWLKFYGWDVNCCNPDTSPIPPPVDPPQGCGDNDT